MKIQFLTLSVFVLFSINGFASEIRGIIKNESGERLSGVAIYSYHVRGGIASSDEKGTFTVPETKVLFFRCEGYQPLTKIIDPATSQLEIVLVDSKNLEIILPVCKYDNKNENRVGQSFKFLVPKDAKVHTSIDDYWYFSIRKNFGNREVVLSGIEGPNATLGVPPEEWILNAVEFTEHSYKNKPQFSDLRGKSKDGTYWRFIGIFSVSIKYSGLTKEEAKYFDNIISSACI